MTAVDVRLDYLAIAARYAASPEQWPVAPRFNPVDRWYHRLAVADDHEVWLLTWLPGQGTDLHDHGGSAGAFLVSGGTLTEETVTGGTLTEETRPTGGRPAGGRPQVTTRELGDGAGRRFGPRHIHRVTNRSARPATSIHVYGPALATMTRYRLTSAGLEIRTVEAAGVQW
ncbi:cysteine dioxygenase [Actinoplanes sp. NPDC051343]|uniref:cysteine dioxygenase n=1 Tax=Actinoplanes sp. NPDC051343 TaxID=3363906 RepID=UPI0037BB3CC1